MCGVGNAIPGSRKPVFRESRNFSGTENREKYLANTRFSVFMIFFIILYIYIFIYYYYYLVLKICVTTPQFTESTTYVVKPHTFSNPGENGTRLKYKKRTKHNPPETSSFFRKPRHVYKQQFSGKQPQSH